MLRETSIGSPLAHAAYLHGAGKGQLTLAQKIDLVPPDDWFQRSGSYESLVEFLPLYEGEKDVYISQNRFYGPRAVSRLTELSALYTDLDYYNLPDLTGMHAVGVLELAFEALSKAQIPPPSLAVATGRGLALVWRHEPVPRYILPKWRYCQDLLFEALKPLGADPAARDAARVLRLVGTYNSKSGTLVESIWENLDFIPRFGDLADRILPLTREEFEEQRRTQHRDQNFAREARKPAERTRGGREGFTLASLFEGRLNDLDRLMELRGWDKVPPGKRDAWMLVGAVSLSHLVEPQSLEKEILF